MGGLNGRNLAWDVSGGGGHMTDQTIKAILDKGDRMELTIWNFRIVGSFVYIGWFSEIDLNC
jgi:hypothetical protein